MPLIAAPPGVPTLVWVIDAQACLGCDLNDPARIVRSVQRSGGGAFATQVIALSDQGEADRGLVEGFLQSHRISGHVAMHSYRDHAYAFGAGPVPGFYLVDGGGTIRAVVGAGEAEKWRSAAESLDIAGFLISLAEEGEEERGGGDGREGDEREGDEREGDETSVGADG